jgi:hypothetical protein
MIKRITQSSALIALVLSTLTSEALAADAGARATRKLARHTTAAASGAFENVCATVKNVTGNEFLYKSEISHHISGGDKRASGPTLICNRVCPPRFPVNLYYSNGALAARLGYYGTWRVTGKARAYCAAGGAPSCSNSTLIRNARKLDGNLYLQTSRATSGSETVCYRVKPMGRTGNPK